jgi:hypothetical protein
VSKQWESIEPHDEHIEAVLYRTAMQGVEQYRVTGEVAGLDAAIRALRVWREYIRLDAEER